MHPFAKLSIYLHIGWEGSAVAQWKSACLETEGSRVRVSPASKSSTGSTRARKFRLCITGILLMGRKESNKHSMVLVSRKSVIGFFRPGPTQISPLSYRDELEQCFACGKF